MGRVVRINSERTRPENAKETLSFEYRRIIICRVCVHEECDDVSATRNFPYKVLGGFKTLRGINEMSLGPLLPTNVTNYWPNLLLGMKWNGSRL